MEVCSLHHPESQGYEMRVGNLLDSLPDFHQSINRKSSSTSSTTLQYPSSQKLKVDVDMKRTHSERDGNPKRSPVTTPRLCPLSTTICQKSSTTTSTNQVLRMSEFQSTSSSSNTTPKISDCEIFLGGSCNPTSWRRDIAIPILNHSGISFFNPQVSSWCPELMAAEHAAKDLASFLFFVIDSETRAVAAMVEVAYLIAQGKNVVLVIAGLPKAGHVICGEPITECEIRDLARAQHLLRYLSNKHEIRVFECIQTAVKTTATLIRKSEGKETRTVTENGTKVKSSETLRVQTCQPLPYSPTPSQYSKLLPKSTSTSYDIFLGGDSMTDDDMGILTKHGLSSWNSSTSNTNDSSLFEDPRMEETNLLFFHLDSSSRGLERLILAAYYVGCARNVILCIEKLDEGCTIDDEILSTTAIKDYNRGRCYLKDIAERHNVPIFSSLPDALEAITRKLRPEEGEPPAP